MLAYTQSLPKLYDDWTLTVPLPEVDQPVGDVSTSRCASRAARTASCRRRATRSSVARAGDDAIVTYHATGAKLGDSFVLHVRDRASARDGRRRETDGGDRYLMVRAPADLGARAGRVSPAHVGRSSTTSARRATRWRGARRRDLIDALLRELDEDDRVAVVAFDVEARTKLAPTRVARRRSPGAYARRSRATKAASARPTSASALDAAIAQLAGVGVSADDAMIVYLGDGVITAGTRNLDALRAQARRQRALRRRRRRRRPRHADARRARRRDRRLRDDDRSRRRPRLARVRSRRGAAHRARDRRARAPRRRRGRRRRRDRVPARAAARRRRGARARRQARRRGGRRAAGGGRADRHARRRAVAAADHCSMARAATRATCRACGRSATSPRACSRSTSRSSRRRACRSEPCQTPDEVREARDEELRKEIVALGKRYFLLSRHTSLLVLENDAMYAQYGVHEGSRRHVGAVRDAGDDPGRARPAREPRGRRRRRAPRAHPGVRVRGLRLRQPALPRGGPRAA